MQRERQDEWIRNPCFWLSLAAPAVFMVAAGGVFLGLIEGSDEQWLSVGLLSFGLAGLVGVRLSREPGSNRAAAGDDPEGASLSADQAANYRDLFENATDIVFTTDLSGHFLAGNKAVERQLGYTVQEAKSLTWEKLVPSYDMWKAGQMYKRHAAGEKRINFELDIIAKNGGIKTFEIGSRPMFDARRLCGFHGIARDITSRKEMETQLESARREAESANESKSTFLANMSHEIRTPINGILGFMSLFAKTELTVQQREYLVPVEESAKHLLKIINDILDLSKIEAGRFSIENEIFSYREVVRSAVDLLRPLGENKGLAIAMEFDTRIPRFLVGDGTRIGQVVSNVVNNAIKFTDAGSVVIENRVREATATHCAIEVSIRDTGIGIAAEDQPMLFEPFQQLDSRTDRKYTGTGLGLTISKNLVEAMGGTIGVASEPGCYTEVLLELPLGVAPDNIDTAGAEATDMSHRFNGHGLSALIVDDNEINRRYLGAVLEQYGLAAQYAASGGAALEACRDAVFDLVFMDIHMADMDGIETARRLRAQQPRYREVPVVAVSADVMGHRGVGFTEQGLDHFLAKPVKEEALLALLSSAFAGRAGAGERPVEPVSGDAFGNDTLDAAAGIALAGNDEELWRRSVDALRRQARDALPSMRSAWRDGRQEDVRRQAHRLSGAARYVAAHELAGRARAIEEACRRRDTVSADQELAELEKAVAQLLSVDIEIPD